MKISTLIGIILSVAIILIAISAKGTLIEYFDPIALLVTLGGTIAALLATYSISNLQDSLKTLSSVYFTPPTTHDDMVDIMVGVSKDSRTLSFIEIQGYDEVQNIPFLLTTITMLADNIPKERISEFLESESRSILRSGLRAAKIFSVASNISPMFGMIGTVIGLIAMLGNIADPAVIPQAMSLALVTTLYGLVLSVVIFRPIAGKISSRSEHEFISREIIIQGISGVIEKRNSEIIRTELTKIYA